MLVRLPIWLISAPPTIRWLFIVGCVFFGGQVGSIAGLSGVLKIINQALESEKRVKSLIRQYIAEASRMEIERDRSGKGASSEEIRTVLSEETFGAPFEIHKMHPRSKEDINDAGQYRLAGH